MTESCFREAHRRIYIRLVPYRLRLRVSTYPTPVLMAPSCFVTFYPVLGGAGEIYRAVQNLFASSRFNSPDVRVISAFVAVCDFYRMRCLTRFLRYGGRNSRKTTSAEVAFTCRQLKCGSECRLTVIYDIFAEYLRNGIQYVVAHRFCGIKTAHVKVCVAVFQICINGNCIGLNGFGIVAVVHIRGHNFLRVPFLPPVLRR
mgnify:CR=1 FL=1